MGILTRCVERRDASDVIVYVLDRELVRALDLSSALNRNIGLENCLLYGFESLCK